MTRGFPALLRRWRKKAAPVWARDVSEKGVEFIARFEGCRLQPYNDAASPTNATIGIGHLIHKGPVTAADKRKYAKFTEADALALFRKDLARYVAGVNALNLKLKQNEMDALVSAAYNLGSVPPHVVALLRLKQKWAAMKVLRLYVYAGGVKLLGLVRRRQAEARMFLKGVYQ